MRIVLTFILNAGLNFALGLAVAAALGPAEYGRFAVSTTLAVVLATGLFDWLRLSTTRFYGEVQRTSDPAVRATLNAAYLGTAGLLVACTGVIVGFRLDVGLSTALLVAAALGAIANGAFDFHAALARARFLDRTYAALVIGKSVLALALALGAAFAFKEPAMVLVAASVGTLLALIPVRRSLTDRTDIKARLDFGRIRRFAGYGMPVVAANILFQIVILMNRSAAASVSGYAAAGQLSLSTDLSLRLLLAVGAAIDVFVFQLAVRNEAENGREAAERQLRLNIVIVTAILMLLGVGFAIAMPAFDALVVPLQYRTDFVPLSLVLLPGILLFCLGQFAINPVFQIAGRTLPIICGALVSFAIDGIGLLVLPPSAGVSGLALLHSSSLAAGFLAVTAAALRNRAMRPPIRDLGCILFAGMVTGLALWPTRSIGQPWLSLVAAAVVGTGVYCTVLTTLNVAGSRTFIFARLALLARIRTTQPVA